MTFRGETLSLAAARATLAVLRDEPVVEHARRGRRAGARGVRRHVRRARHRGPADRPGRAPYRRVRARRRGVRADRLRTLFLQECAAHGVLTTGTLLPSYAHDDDAVERTSRHSGGRSTRSPG